MFKEEAKKIIDSRIEELRNKTFKEASALPDEVSEECLVAGEKTTISVFRQSSPYQLEGKVLITVLVSKPRFVGLISSHTERGLVFSPDGEVREATENELQYTGG